MFFKIKHVIFLANFANGLSAMAASPSSCFGNSSCKRCDELLPVLIGLVNLNQQQAAINQDLLSMTKAAPCSGKIIGLKPRTSFFTTHDKSSITQAPLLASPALSTDDELALKKITLSQPIVFAAGFGAGAVTALGFFYLIKNPVQFRAVFSKNRY